MESFIREAFSGIQTLFSVFLLIGLVEFIVLFLIYRHRRTIEKRGQETTGTVIDVVQGRSTKGGRIYKPVYQFTTWQNEVITKTSTVGSNPMPYKVGNEVIVVYNPEQPQQFVIRGDKRYRLLMLIFSFHALVFFLIGGIGSWSFLKT